MPDGECRECGRDPDGGALCDRCDAATGDTSNCSAGWRAEMHHQGVVPGVGVCND